MCDILLINCTSIEFKSGMQLISNNESKDGYY